MVRRGTPRVGPHGRPLIAHLDFDTEGPTKDKVQSRLNDLLSLDRPVSSQWITDDELLANPGIIETRAVKPTIGTGRAAGCALMPGGDCQTWSAVDDHFS